MAPFDPTPYVGLPYLAGGRDRGGIDCWGLVRIVYAEQLGIDLPAYDTIAAGDRPRVRAATAQEAASGWAKAVVAQPFDVLTFDRGAHVGIALDRTRMLHAEKGRDACVERWSQPTWLGRLHGIWRRA